MRRLVAVLVGLALSIPLAAISAGVSVAAETPLTQVDGFRACISGGGVTDMLLLVDESSSLNRTDPDFARVTSASYLVTQLGGFASESSAEVNVAVSVFANSYTQIQPWTPLNAGTLPQLQSTVSSLKDRVNGMETDYWTALDGARKDLAARAAARTEKESCQALVWFTDGGINYTIRANDADKAAYGAAKPFAPDTELTSAEAAESVRTAAMTDICRPGGVADQLRSSQVALFGIGLQGNAESSGDFLFMESVATGAARTDAAPCGKLIDPVPGEFHLATDIDSLLLAFDGISSPGSRPITQDAGICQVSVCIDKAHRFVLDQSTPGVRVLATADGTNLAASLLNPAGQVISLPKSTIGSPQSLLSDDNKLTYTWLSDKSLTVSMTEGSSKAGWSGLWQLAFTDPIGQSGGRTSKSSIHIAGSLKPAWLNPAATSLHVGETIPDVRLGLVDAAGKNVDAASLLGEVQLSATLVSGQGRSSVVAAALGKDAVANPVSLDLAGYPVGAAELVLELSITTAATTTADGTPVPGTPLEPALVSVPLALLPPAEFPVLASKVDFGQSEGNKELSASLPVSGVGCVWQVADQPPEILAGPADVGAIAVTLGTANSAENCLHVKDLTSLPLTFKADQAGNGSVNGRVALMIAPDGEPGKAMPVNVDFTASMAKPLNSANFLLALLVALILGPGIPLLFLYAAKWYVSKIPGIALSAELIPVTVLNEQVQRDGQLFSLRPTDLTDLVPMKPSGTRSLMINGLELKARSGWSPFGSGFVSILAPGRFAAGSVAPGTDNSGVNARLPLAVHNHWAVLRDVGGDPRSCYVLVLVSGTAAAAQKRDIEGDINRRLPDVLARLNDKASKLEDDRRERPASGQPALSPSSTFPSPWEPADGRIQPGRPGEATHAPAAGGEPSGFSPWGTPHS
ncbi:von Willebrand factor type A domain-containing protein [Arthrobacter sp. SLBN-100]|uniref:vWA domain-containing protein n=1 Tax=Arthrobacter sp. SLBN-100 TaxID=2768450 RepID=UPI00116DE4E2|nr:VWA domain-containing protein [Arthrobacter sp. SLBN-100]TQJ69712.1 von Willebrand factor type A domain-containing protein [Arthrobacter sp. SLBN-100]